MATNIKNFYRGDTKAWKFNFGSGSDITGWKIYLTLKENSDDSDELAVMQVFNVAGDTISDDVANGVMYVSASSVDTASLEPDTSYFYGFQRIISGVGSNPPDVKTLLTGRVKILQDITLTVV